MRAPAIGTGPFKFVEFRPNDRIRGPKETRVLEAGPALSRRRRVADRSEPGDADPGVRREQFRSGLRSDIPAAAGSQEPGAAGGDVFPANLPRTLLVNRTIPPFDNPELRRAMALSPDQAFIDILTL